MCEVVDHAELLVFMQKQGKNPSECTCPFCEEKLMAEQTEKRDGVT